MVFLPFKGIPEEELLRQQQELFQQARLQQAQVIYTYSKYLWLRLKGPC